MVQEFIDLHKFQFYFFGIIYIRKISLFLISCGLLSIALCTPGSQVLVGNYIYAIFILHGILHKLRNPSTFSAVRLTSVEKLFLASSGPLQRLTTQALALSGVAGVGGNTSSGNQGVEGGGEAGIGDRDLFEELCSNRSSSMGAFDDMWTDKEKEITFTQESQQEER